MAKSTETIGLTKQQVSTLMNVVFFPGAQVEYERFVGDNVEVIDTGRINKGVFYREIKPIEVSSEECKYNACDVRLAKKLADQGIVALLCQGSPSENSPDNFYGLPIRMKPE